jgi:hypothetical protein
MMFNIISYHLLFAGSGSAGSGSGSGKAGKLILSSYYQISQICIIRLKGEKFKLNFLSIFDGIFLHQVTELSFLGSHAKFQP